MTVRTFAIEEVDYPCWDEGEWIAKEMVEAWAKPEHRPQEYPRRYEMVEELRAVRDYTLRLEETFFQTTYKYFAPGALGTVAGLLQDIAKTSQGLADKVLAFNKLGDDRP
jgi:hypothetical protein